MAHASLPRRRSWHFLLVLIPDAEAPSLFAWCVDAPGFAPLGRMMEDRSSQVVDAPLIPSSTEATCPATLDSDALEQGTVRAARQ
jgi:hypothetical protein